MITLLTLLFALQQTPIEERFWGQWRGPFATGVSKTAQPPLEWSETKNVRWKIEIPGRGSGSPIVWGDRVYLTTAIPAGIAGDAAHRPLGAVQPRLPHRFVVMALNRSDGRIAWERTVREETPHEGAHVDNGSWASSSPVTDGQHLFAFFESRGLYAFDMEGNLLWEKDFGDKRMRNQFGEGSTPALYRDRLVVVWDQQGGQSFVVALNKNTGEEIWRVDRTEIDTWATPLIVEHGGRAQVIVPGMNRLRSYDLENGQIVWESAGLTMNPIPSPVAADGMVFATSGFQGNNLKAIRLDGAAGDITSTGAIVWSLDRDTPYVPSPLLYDGILYILKTNNGILSAFDAKTGKPHYQAQRLAAVPNVFASPVGAAAVYISLEERERRWLFEIVPNSKFWQQTRLTMDSMRRRRWWIARSICAGKSICTASRNRRRQGKEGYEMKTHLAWISLVLVLTVAGLSSAQTRGRGGAPAAPLDIAGAWTGTWSSYSPTQATTPPREVCAKLDAKVAQVNGVWEATFEGDCGRPYKYSIKMEGRQTGNAVLFQGTADLGAADGGVYDWIGRATNTEFIGFYTNAFTTGVFSLKRAE